MLTANVSDVLYHGVITGKCACYTGYCNMVATSYEYSCCAFGLNLSLLNILTFTTAVFLLIYIKNKKEG